MSQVDWSKSMSSIKDQLQGVALEMKGNAQQRLVERRYLVRVIDARDGWSKFVHESGGYTASKSKAERFDSLDYAVNVRNSRNKDERIKGAWIVFE